jgi:glucose dehydrogenase
MTLGLTSAHETSQTPYSTWSDYAGSPDSRQYSSLTQITKADVSQLELAWFYPVPDRKGNFGFNPLIDDGSFRL